MSNSVKKTAKKQKRGNPNLPNPGPGRPKGSRNKFTDLKQAYLNVFEKIEKESLKKDSGVKSFFEWATKNNRNQGMFYQMISKMLPSNVSMEHSGTISFELSEKYMPKDNDESK